jgi:predicted  nucleic acid-binding Zn-ribbon protein
VTLKTIANFAEELTQLVDRARRLPAPMSHRPHEFSEAKSELANDIRKLRDELVAAHGDRKTYLRSSASERVMMAEGTIRAEKGNRVVVTFRNRQRKRAA